jgi:bifunctional non-homologous end joining protein LigD
VARAARLKAVDPMLKRRAREPDAHGAGHALRDYAEKRAFDVTPEPPAQAASQRTGPLLFVVQQHSARRLHYDFRLELDGVLKSWAVPDGPSLDPKVKRLAVPVEDHPFDYASFEGVIPAKQYGAGEVIVWDCGLYSPDEGKAYAFGDRAEAQQRLRTEYAKGKISFFLLGEKLKGSWTLVRMKDKDWLLIKHKDRFARSDVDVRSRAASVLSGHTVADLKVPKRLERVDAARLIPNGPAESTPAKLAPMLAASADAPFNDPAFLYEPKLDGYRCLAAARCACYRGAGWTKARSSPRSWPRSRSRCSTISSSTARSSRTTRADGHLSMRCRIAPS